MRVTCSSLHGTPQSNDFFVVRQMVSATGQSEKHAQDVQEPLRHTISPFIFAHHMFFSLFWKLQYLLFPYSPCAPEDNYIHSVLCYYITWCWCYTARRFKCLKKISPASFHTSIVKHSDFCHATSSAWLSVLYVTNVLIHLRYIWQKTVSYVGSP